MKIYTLTGCGGIGKNAVLDEVLKRNKKLKVVVSTTSRPMRKGEIQGVSYNFVENKTAKQMIRDNKFIEKRIYNVIDNGQAKQWIYGITKESIDFNSDNTYIVIVDLNGLEELESYLNANKKGDCLTSIYIDGSKQNRLLRYLQREHMDDSKVDEAVRRFIDDNKSVLPAKKYCDFVVNNDGNIENAINRVLDIMED